MSAALDRWLTRLYHAVGASLFLGLCAIVSYTAGDWHWLDQVRSSELPPPEVSPGGVLGQGRGIVRGADCALQAAHRPPSVGPARRRAMRPDIALDAPPWDRDGRPETVETEASADCLCGRVTTGPRTAGEP